MFKFILKGSIGTIDIIEIYGPLLEKTAVQARDRLMDRLKHGVTDIVLLCSNLNQIDSCSISLLIEISDHLQPRGGKLHLVGCPLPVILPMKSLGMVHFFQFYKTEDEVFSALNITPNQVVPHNDLTERSVKRQVAIKDHIRNKMILFKHHENASVRDIISYLQSTYAHFRDREIKICLRKKIFSEHITLLQLFNEYGYTTDDMLEVRDVTPAPPNYREMFKRGGKLYEQAVFEILVEEGVLERQVANSAKEIAELNQDSLIVTLVEGDYIEESLLLRTLGKKLKIPIAHLYETKISAQDVKLLTREKALSYAAVPLKKDEERLCIAMVNPFDREIRKEIQQHTNCKLKAFLATKLAIRKKIEELYPKFPERIAIVPEPQEDEMEQSAYFAVPLEASSPVLESSKDVDIVNLVTTNVEQYPAMDTMPMLLSESLATIHKVERVLNLLQRWHQEFARLKNLDETVNKILDMALLLMPLECAIFFLYEKQDWIFYRCQPVPSSPYSISQEVLDQVQKNKNINISKCGNANQLHIAIPFISGDHLLGTLYLLYSPKSSYDQEALRMFSALTGHASLALENMILRERNNFS